MTSMSTEHAQLDRAHVQGKVIEANLKHLGLVLSAAERGLRDELASFTRGFGLYVGRLNDACTAADADDRALEARPHNLESAEPDLTTS